MKSKLIISLLSLTVSSCSTFDVSRIAPGYIEAFQTIRSTYFSDNTLDISSEAIKSIPYASALLRIGKGAQGLIILESIESGKETWVSADGLFLVIQDGRIIRTAGIEHNLIDFKSNIDITLENNSSQSYYQYYSYDKPSLKDLRISAKLIYKGYREVILFDQIRDLLLVEEVITSEYHGWSFVNQYWLDNKGFIVKSRQKISPKLPFFEIEITKKPAV